SATDGERVWKQLLAGRPAAAPSLGESAVFVADDTFVHALGRADGSRRWRLGIFGAGTPVPVDKDVALASVRPRFATALHEARGDFRWSYSLAARATAGPLHAGGRILLAAPLPGGDTGSPRTLLR